MNISAGTGVPVFSNSTTRDAGFGGAGEKVLAEGQLCYLSSTNFVEYYDGAAWQPVGASSGLTLISSTTIGTTVSSVTVSSAFSATYDAYKITISGGVGSANDVGIFLQLGATTTGYKWALNTSGASGSFGDGSTSAAGINLGLMDTNLLYLDAEVFNPFLAKYTFAHGTVYDNLNFRVQSKSGIQPNTTSYTAFTLFPGSGTMTGGTVRVYGYANS
jgi:hypothetical protein